MELIQAIALLCQMDSNLLTKDATAPKRQTECVQSYLNCVRTKTGYYDEAAKLERCILEK